MAVCPQYDFHIHTKYIAGKPAMEELDIPAIVSECKRIGVQSLAITDHLNGPEFLDKHVLILEAINRLESPGIDVYFGAELNFTGCCKGFPFSSEIKEKYGFQFAIGGIHGTYVKEYDINKIVDMQHKHHLNTCEDPLVDVLVHPYWFLKGEFLNNNWPLFASMKAVPEKHIRELAQASKETKTAIEINAMANLQASAWPEDYVKGYIEYLGILAEEGVVFSVGSDAHRLGHLEKIRDSWKVVEDLNIPPERIWRPDAEPLKN